MNIRTVKEYLYDLVLYPINVCLLEEYKGGSSIILIKSSEYSNTGHYVLLYYANNIYNYVDPYGNKPLKLFLKYDDTIYDRQYKGLQNIINTIKDHKYIDINYKKTQTDSSLCGILCILYFYLLYNHFTIDQINKLFDNFKFHYKITVEDYLEKDQSLNNFKKLIKLLFNNKR